MSAADEEMNAVRCGWVNKRVAGCCTLNELSNLIGAMLMHKKA